MSPDVVRGPDGKFRSAEDVIDHDIDRYTGFNGTLSTTIPAADLSGQVQQDVTGDIVELIDFGDFLDSDESFIPWLMQFSVSFATPTTATAEGHAFIEAMFRMDESGIAAGGAPSFYGGGVDEQGVADVRQRDIDSKDILHEIVLDAAPSIADSASGLAGGADSAQDVTVIDARGAGSPWAAQEDDELYIPHRINTDQIDDHAVTASFSATLHGPVIEEEF